MFKKSPNLSLYMLINVIIIIITIIIIIIIINLFRVDM